MTSHSGFKIRGIVSDKPLESDQAVLRVPKKLWFTLDKFPDIRDVQLAQVPHCGSPLPEAHLRLIKIAGALARERKKGNESFYHAYISQLPTLDDFRSSVPLFMNADLQEDFAGLPLASIATELQIIHGRLRNCFLSWTKAKNSPVVGITSDEFDLAHTLWKTRAFHANGSPVMVPGADFLNTEIPVKINTIWTATKDDFGISTSRFEGTGSGAEMYDWYCEKCDNTIMMASWGTYLEGNPNPLKTQAVCHSQIDPSKPRKHGKFKSLRDTSEAMLDLKDVDAALKEGRNAPRCREEVLSLEQGPLRCSYARLAFEHCKMEWGYLGSRMPEYSLVQKSLDLSSMADLISRSYIHAVHPALLSTGRSFPKNLRKSQRNQIGTS